MKSTGRIEAIIQTLKDYGPMTRSDLEVALSLNKAQTSRLMKCIINASKRIPQRAHIRQYVYDQEGQKRYPRAVYVYGPGKNAEKPLPDKQAIQKRSRNKRKSLIATNSVFNLALGIPYATRNDPHFRKRA
jgi:hypothetical protein